MAEDQDIANYAFTLSSRHRRRRKVFLWFGYGDYAKVWLNGDVVYENIARRNFPIGRPEGSASSSTGGKQAALQDR